jgi:hypothetical protein
MVNNGENHRGSCWRVDISGEMAMEARRNAESDVELCSYPTNYIVAGLDESLELSIRGEGLSYVGQSAAHV